MKKKYIFIKDENGKRRRYQHIEGDDISCEEFFKRLNQQKISSLKFQMEKIRTDNRLDEMQKSSRQSEVLWRLRQLEREMDR